MNRVGTQSPPTRMGDMMSRSRSNRGPVPVTSRAVGCRSHLAKGPFDKQETATGRQTQEPCLDCGSPG